MVWKGASLMSAIPTLASHAQDRFATYQIVFPFRKIKHKVDGLVS